MVDNFTPTLESITLTGKYVVTAKTFQAIADVMKTQLVDWTLSKERGNSMEFLNIAPNSFPNNEEKGLEIWHKRIRRLRYGAPAYFSCIAVERVKGEFLVEVQCRPSMWLRIATLKEKNFSSNQVQEALIECKLFVKRIMSSLNSKEFESISVYPIIQRTEIKDRLINLGLKECVEHLDKAEKHIIQSNFEESLKSSRTAFEKAIDWEIKKRGLEKTNNYKNDLERLQSKGFIDSITTELIQTYYRFLSNIAVHSKGETSPGLYEAQMGFGFTLIMLQYFADKLP